MANNSAGNDRKNIQWLKTCSLKFFEVGDREMLQVLHRLQEVNGFALGGCAGIDMAGIDMAGAMHIAHTVVMVLCDLTGRYAGKLYSRVF